MYCSIYKTIIPCILSLILFTQYPLTTLANINAVNPDTLAVSAEGDVETVTALSEEDSDYAPGTLSSDSLTREITSARTENTLTYERSDHSNTTFIYADPVNYLTDEGYFRLIDNRLHYTPKDEDSGFEGYTNTAASYDVRFAKEANEDRLLSLKEGRYGLVLAYVPSEKAGMEPDTGKTSVYYSRNDEPGNAPATRWIRKITLVEPDETVMSSLSPAGETVPSEADGLYPEIPRPQTVFYEGIEDGADLRYELTPDGIKETIILSKASAPASYTFSFDLQGLKAEKASDGGVLLYKKSGDDTSVTSGIPEEKEGIGCDPAFVIPAPMVTDAEGNDDCEASYEISRTGDGKLILKVAADEKWLREKDRAFPVEIDPTIKKYRRYDSLKGLGDFVSVNKKGKRDSETLYVGERVDGKGEAVWRTFINPNLPDIPKGSIVTEALLRINASDSDTPVLCIPMTAPWSPDRVSFKSITDKDKLSNVTDFGKKGLIRLDITKDVKRTLEGGTASYGWCLLSAFENKPESGRIVRPHKGMDYPFLEITYSDFTGTEEYYSSHTQTVGNAGVGYINDYTGRLSFTHPDAKSAGERMPFSVSHIHDMVFGERSIEKKWQKSGTAGGHYGEHMRLSTEARLLVPAGETDVGRYPYVYIDPDGTKHYFKKADVSYYTNNAKQYADKGNAEYPGAKDEDGLGLFVVPVKNKSLKEKYPLKIVNKSGSTSMYFDTDGYLSMIRDSNQREDGDNKSKKDENSITISYESEDTDSSKERESLLKIRDEIKNAYDENELPEKRSERAASFIEEIEIFEGESLNVSVNYKMAYNLQKAKESLQKITERDTNHKSDLNNAAGLIDKALEGDFRATVKRTVAVTDASGETAEFIYEGDRLSSMTDPFEGGRPINYRYDDKGRLISISHPDGTCAEYAYDKEGHPVRVTDERGYSISYDYKARINDGIVTTDQVTGITEYYGKTVGQTVLVDHSGFNTTVYTFSGRDDKLRSNNNTKNRKDGKDDIENVYCFDHKGRTVCTYSRGRADKKVMGAVIRNYTEDNEDRDDENRIKETAGTGSIVINLLTDSSFEKGSDAWDISDPETMIKGDAVKRDTKEKYMGSGSALVNLAPGGPGREGSFRQSVKVPESGNYTASVYIHAKDLDSTSRVSLKLSTKKKISETGDSRDSEKSTGETVDGDSEPVYEGEGDTPEEEESGDDGSGTSEEGFADPETQPDINYGWKRLETTVSADKNDEVTITLSLSGISGSVWFDCAQLEKGDLANQYNLLPNSGFEGEFRKNPSLTDLPSGWSFGADAVSEDESLTGDDSEVDSGVDVDGLPDAGTEAEPTGSKAVPDMDAVKVVDISEAGNGIIEGSKVLMIKGSPIKCRHVVINPNFGDEKTSYTFSCYVKAECAPLSDRYTKRRCGIYVRGSDSSYDEDSATGIYNGLGGGNGTYTQINTQYDGWQYVTLALPVKKWKGKLIEIRFDNEMGNLFIDGCMLTGSEVQTKTYTASGKLKTSQKGERTTAYATDGRDRRRKETEPGGATTSYAYDSVTNDLKTETHIFRHPGGQPHTLTTRYSYDRFGNQTGVDEKQSGSSKAIVTETGYDADGRFPITETDSRGNVTSKEYDQDTGLVLKTTDPDGTETAYSYDTYQHPKSVGSSSVGVRFEYGRIVKGLDRKKHSVHDLLTAISVEPEVIAAGKTGDQGKDPRIDHSLDYDPYFNVKRIRQLVPGNKGKKTKNQLVEYTYGKNNGKLQGIVYGGEKNGITFKYNDLEQLVSEKWKDGASVEYEYDNRGNRARVTDTGNHLKYRYFYDEKGRVTTAEISKYDKDRTESQISFQNIYDKAGRQSVFAWYTGNRAYRTEYGYTSDDKVSNVKLPTGGVFRRTYDGFDRIVKDVFTPQEKAETEEEKKSRETGKTVTTTYGFISSIRDPEKETEKDITDPKSPYTTRLLSTLETIVGTGSGKRTAISEELRYDSLGRIESYRINGGDCYISPETDAASEYSYTYDELGRLTIVEDTGKGRKWEYVYDPIGNLTDSTYSVITEENDGYQTVKEEHYDYRSDNLTGITERTGSGEEITAETDDYAGGNPKTYLNNSLTWFHGRQLKRVDPPDDKKKINGYSVEKPVSFTYAYDGSRLSKTVGGGKKEPGITTEYVLNGSMILSEKTGDERMNFYYSADGRLLEIGYQQGTKPETHYTVIRNALGDVTALYTASGTLVGTYEYDPYGLLLSETPASETSDPEGILRKNPFRYRGYYYDEETGWYYLQSRYYDPKVKRFINADSTDLLTTDCTNIMQYNLFMYCNGDPVNGYDPSGKEVVLVATGAVVAAADVLIIIEQVIISAVVIYAAYEASKKISQDLNGLKNKESKDIEDEWLDDESPTKEKIGKNNGNSPRSNEAQNKQFRDVLKNNGITRKSDKARSFHDYISKQGFNHKELSEERDAFFGHR